MEHISNLSQYNQVVNDFQKHSDVFTNNLLMVKDIENYIDKNKLFYDLFEDALLVYCEEESFYHLHFHMNIYGSPSFRKYDKPVVAECFRREGSITSRWLNGVNLLEKLGFKEMVSSKHYTFMNKNIDFWQENFFDTCGEQFCIEKAQKKDVSSLLFLWREHFTDFHSVIPSEEDLLNDIENGLIICIFNADDKLCATNRLRIDHKNISIWLVAVDKKYRRCGLAQVLLNYDFMVMTQKDCTNCFLWVVDDNEKAQKYFIKRGFVFDGRIAHQYVLY